MAYIRRGEFKDHRIWKDKGRWAGFIAYANDTVNNPEVPIDEKLDVHLRGNEVHVYYKGGRILKITSRTKNFDSNYFYLKKSIRIFPEPGWNSWLMTNRQSSVKERLGKNNACLWPRLKRFLRI